MDIYSPATFYLGGSKRLLLNEDGYDLIFEQTPFYKTEYQYICETDEYHIYNPPLIKNKFFCCVYAYTINPKTIKLYKNGRKMEYIVEGKGAETYDLRTSFI